MARLALVVAALALLVGTSLASVVVLTPDNFDSVVDGSKAVLVEFYAPWCGHCKNLAPVYDELGEAYAHASKDVIIAKLDADAHRELGSRFDVRGFPTIKFFAKGTTTPVEYTSGRDLASFVDFISEMTGVRSKLAVKKEAVLKLDDESFDSIVLDTTKDVLVEFYASWCGHCKTLAPKYERVAQTYERESNIVIAAIDADKFKGIGGRFSINGFPTIKFFPRNNKEGEDYNGGRTEEDIVAFINERTGSKRTVGGGLNEEAGRIPELDEIASKFVAASDKAALITQAKAIAKNAGPAAIFYVKYMEKIAASGAAFVGGEVSRLERLIAGGAIAGGKLDDINVRRNVLKVF